MTKQRSVVRVAQRAASQDTRLRDKVNTALTNDGQVASTVDSFVNFAAKLGIGADNQMSASNYTFNPITRNRILLEWMYRGSWITGLAVDLVADDMTRAGIEIKAKMRPQDLERMEDRAADLDLWGKINEAIKWGRLYGGSIAVLMIDGQDPRTPLDINTIRPGQFKGLAVFDRWMLEPSLEDLVTEFNQFTGTPRYYRVLSNAPMMQGKAVHYSRIVLRGGGVKLPYQQALIENMWDLSVVERVYDRLVAFDSATTGAAQLVYKCYLRTLKVESLREIVSAGQNAKALQGLTQYVQMMAKYQGIEGVTLVDAKDDYTSEHHGAFSGLSDVMLQFGQQLSGALQIPLVRLFGQSPAGLNSTGESDVRTYYDNVNSQQNKVMKVGITKLYQVLAKSLGISVPDNFRIQFRPLWQLTEEQRASITKTVVEAVSAAKEAALISDYVAMSELRQISDLTGIFTNIKDEDIEKADRFIEPPTLLEAMGSILADPKVRADVQLKPPGAPLPTAPLDVRSPGRRTLQLPAPSPSPAGGPDSAGLTPQRRRLQLEPDATNNPDLVQQRAGGMGGVVGGANASGRF